MKKLMLLGGTRFLLPVIEAAHRLGVYVITCDYLPENVAHKASDAYCNASVIDKEAVLHAAKGLEIDGIMSFACDPGVVTAAYVAEKMGLPFQGPYRSVSILQDKGLFRQFLTEHGFNCPRFRRFVGPDIPVGGLDGLTWPLIVKPTDSCGSKGVTRVDRPKDLPEAIRSALANSRNGAFIAEEFLSVDGFHSDTDPFLVDGKLLFCTFSDEFFDADAKNPYVPICTVQPSSMPPRFQTEVKNELERLMSLLEMTTGIFNIAVCVAGGRPYIMEVSPRGGGEGLAEMETLAYGIDLIENEVRHAVGLPTRITEPTGSDGCWCMRSIYIQSGQSGTLRSVSIDEEIRRKYLKRISISAMVGDRIEPLSGANKVLGEMILRFDSREELNENMSRIDQWLHVDLM